MKKTVLTSFTFLCLLSAMFLMGLTFNIQPVEANETIYIRATGEVDGTNKIQREGDFYTFITNINNSIVVERDNIVVDGVGFTLQGSGNGIGIALSSRSNATVKNLHIKGFNVGLYVIYSSDCLISNNNMTCDIELFWSSNITISENNITNSQGIYVYSSSDNTIRSNNITYNDGGILLEGTGVGPSCDYNSIVENNIVNNINGIHLMYSSNNTLRNNHMAGNQHSFGVLGASFPNFIHDMDSSNTVEGKPVCYWINHQNEKVPVDSGYVALVNSTNLIVENQHLRNNLQGLLLVNTRNSVVMGTNLTDNDDGIHLVYSFNNTICENNITDNGVGIFLSDLSGNNRIFQNKIAGNDFYGFLMTQSSNNLISENNISNNVNCGISFEYSSNNRFYHNNFINHTQHVRFYQSGVNFWDDGYPFGGNYWDDYGGTDLYSGVFQNETGNDGIGDNSHPIDENNEDEYPLMNPFVGFSFAWGRKTYPVGVNSNSTTTEFHFSQEDKLISFEVGGPDGTPGFCNVTIPHDLLGGSYAVLVDGSPPLTINEWANGTHTFIHFTYNHSTKQIKITGTTVIPEVPSFLILPLFMIATLLAVILYRRKHSMHTLIC